MKKILSILSVLTISSTSIVSVKNNINITIKNNFNGAKFDYLDGTDTDFVAYLGMDAINIMTDDFTNGDKVDKVMNDMLTQTNFDLGNVSKEALYNTFDYCVNNVASVMNIITQEGPNGVSVRVINYIPDVSTATPIM